MTLFDIFLLIGFFVYNFSLIYYASHVFEYQKSTFKFALITSILNCVVLAILLFFSGVRTEFSFIVVYLLIYTIEFRMMSKRGLLVVLFGSFSFALNLFSRRLIVLALIALFNGISMKDVIHNDLFDFLVGFIPFVISPPSVYFTKKKLKRHSLHILFSDKRILCFAVLLMGTTLVYQLCIVLFLEAPKADIGFIFMYLVSGIVITVAYYVAMAFTGMFSKLKLQVIRYHKLSKSVQDEEKNLRTIHEQALIDSVTGLYIRDVAIDEIQKCLDNHEDFHVVYIDLDGLKTVNDSYGHPEGDFYIDSLCSILKSTFPTQTISRVGGDEFLIVSRTDEFDTTQSLIRAYIETKNIAKDHDKPYETSFSYGIVDVSKTSKNTVNQIVEEADNKMYTFKRSRSKERK